MRIVDNLQDLNDLDIDVSLFDLDRFGLGDFFVKLIIAECAEDGDRGSFGEHLHKFRIDLPDELFTIVPGSFLDLFAIAIGVVAVRGNGEIDNCISIFEVDDVSIVS